MRYSKEFDSGTIVDFINEWEQFFGKDTYNWKEIHLCMARLEDNKMFGEFEIELYILGFGFRIAWIYNSKVFNKKMSKYKKMASLYQEKKK